MKLLTDYKKGTFVTFKWYERWQDAYEKLDNFTIGEGIVENTSVLGKNLIIYNGHENKYYAVNSSDVIKAFNYETTNQEEGI